MEGRDALKVAGRKKGQRNAAAARLEHGKAGDSQRNEGRRSWDQIAATARNRGDELRLNREREKGGLRSALR